jgi:hypothetical protein
MFVLLLAILSLITPMSALCTPAQQIHHADHACCAAAAQLAAPSCCPDATPAAPMPRHASDQVLSGFTLSPVRVALRVSANPQVAKPRTGVYLSILLPATILRT